MNVTDFLGNDLQIGNVLIHYSPTKNKLAEVIIKKVSSISSISKGKNKTPIERKYIIVVDLQQVLNKMKLSHARYEPIKSLWDYLQLFSGYRISNFNHVYRICDFDECF